MSGRSNKITSQIGEFLACAELGRQGLIATPFAGNVPEFDVLVADDSCHSLPIQVKASNSSSWPGKALDWMDIRFDEPAGRQTFVAKKEISCPELIYIYVRIAPSGQKNHRFFVLTKAELQDLYIKSYHNYMDPKGWIRPRKPDSYDNRIKLDNLMPYEDNWGLIKERLMTGRGETR